MARVARIVLRQCLFFCRPYKEALRVRKFAAAAASPRPHLFRRSPIIAASVRETVKKTSTIPAERL